MESREIGYKRRTRPVEQRAEQQFGYCEGEYHPQNEDEFKFLQEEEEGEDLDEAVGNDHASKNPNESHLTGAGKSSVAAFDSKFFPKENRQAAGRFNKKITMDERISKMKDISASARKVEQQYELRDVELKLPSTTASTT